MGGPHSIIGGDGLTVPHRPNVLWEKPIQREHFGELSEGLSGSTKSVACVERNVRNLGGPKGSCHG